MLLHSPPEVKGHPAELVRGLRGRSGVGGEPWKPAAAV